MNVIRHITFVTSNNAKFTTAFKHLKPLGIMLEQVSLKLDEIQSNLVEEVALHKARQAFSRLNRPLIIEDSGFYIDELNGFPGPLVKYILQSLGTTGITKVAGLTKTRKCHFEGVLAYLDANGEPYIFKDRGSGGVLAEIPVTQTNTTAWSSLWDIYIPHGYSAPMSALPETERVAMSARWASQSVFTQFGRWYMNLQQNK